MSFDGYTRGEAIVESIAFVGMIVAIVLSITGGISLWLLIVLAIAVCVLFSVGGRQRWRRRRRDSRVFND